MSSPSVEALTDRCDLLRSLHRPDDPLLLPNIWDVATARAVVVAGYPVVATTSWGVAKSLGYEDDEKAPADEMLAAAARIAKGVDVPVTVDTEAGYGMDPSELVAKLLDIGAAGCNLEDTDHAAGEVRPLKEHASWLAEVRKEADALAYPLVINARVDLMLEPYIAEAEPGTQVHLVSEALERANAYLDVGADCVYPICLWEPAPLETFMAGVGGLVNLAWVPQLGSVDAIVATGAARISWAIFLFEDTMAHFSEQLGSLR